METVPLYRVVREDPFDHGILYERPKERPCRLVKNFANIRKEQVQRV